MICVDDDDRHFLSEYKWNEVQIHRTTYAVAKVGRKTTYLHRLIMGCTPGDGKEVDHRDGDGLNNRRSNLRVVTHRQNLRNQRMNARNTSGHRGVSFDKRPNARHKPWYAQVKHEGKVIRIGHYATKEEAAAARLAWEAEHWH